MKRWIVPALVTILVATAGAIHLASAASLPVTSSNVNVFQLTTRPPTPYAARVSATDDTWVDSLQATANHGADTKLGVSGSSTVALNLYGAGNTNVQQGRAYLRFDLSGIPTTATVQSAVIALSGGPTSIGTSPVVARRVTSAWSESTLTYSSRPTISVTQRTSSVVNQSGVMIATIDVTADFSGGVASAANGFEIRASATTGSWWYSSEYATASLRPTLTVVYK